MKEKQKVVIYQAKNGAIELRGDISHETVWATQAQIADIFNIDRTVSTKHIGNILKSKEVDEKSNVQKMHIANSDKPVTLYSLDIILAVGYRANSGRAIEFRKWATKTMRNYITDGFVVNKSKVKNNYEAFMRVVGDIQALLPEHTNLDPKAVLDLVREFAGTWMSLDAYDKGTLEVKGITKKNIKLTSEELISAISSLRDELIIKKEATELFANERGHGGIHGIVGNVMQTFGGKALYMTLEDKAAHLLYFIVKNHVFVDGNKRSGAFAFIWFLKKFNIKGFKNINPATLTALTLFIAESHPEKKEIMIRLILQILK